MLQSSVKHVVVPVLLLVLAGCTKENTPVAALVQPVAAVNPVQKGKAEFTNGPYGSVSGQAKIYQENGNLVVGFENFSSANGPDLKVYLSLELNPRTFVNIGSLKSTTGNQVYNCPAGTDINKYKYVLIYCQQYSHLFGQAELK
ncbi:MAG: DM13 domain-containing protein [Sediminibacterium sp.]